MEFTIAKRPVTSGPKFHWFGYYDKFQFDITGRYALGMEVDFEHRAPNEDCRMHFAGGSKGNLPVDFPI